MTSSQDSEETVSRRGRTSRGHDDGPGSERSERDNARDAEPEESGGGPRPGNEPADASGVGAGARDESGSGEGDPPLSEGEWLRMEEELAEARDRHLRLAAEFENYRKRTRQELGQSGTRAQAALVGSLLDALDDFDRIVEMDPESATTSSILEGVQLVERKLRRALSDAGVETLAPEGEPFDPEIMDAVMREPTEEEEDDDMVSRVLQKGVVFKGHLVRPARVAVWKLD